jgi:type I restriction enzyme M protein
LPANTNQALSIIRLKEGHNPFYVASILRSHIVTDKIENLKTGVAQFNLSLEQIKDFEIPLPPLEIQQQIVAEIEGYKKIVDGAKQIVSNYKPTISINPDWEIVELGEVCEDFKNGLNFGTDQVGRGTKFINIKDVFSECYVDVANLEQVDVSEKEKASKKVTDNDLLFVRSSVKYEGVGFPSLVKTNGENIVFCGFIIKCTPNKNIIVPEYLLYLLRTQKYRDATVSLSNRSSITNISQDNLKILKVPIPSIQEQQTIVKAIEEEMQLVNANKRLIEIFEQKIKTKIGEVWGVKEEVSEL